jgi:hypothetical protein
VRRLVAALGLLLTAASPASAYLVEVTTSIALGDREDEAAVRQAVLSAVDDVLKEAIAFKPTMVVLTSATVVGDRLYIRLLVADQAGEETFEELKPPGLTAEPTDLKI